MILIDVMELLKSTEQVREIMANNCHVALERKLLSSNILYLLFCLYSYVTARYEKGKCIRFI